MTYVPTWAGFVHLDSVLDVWSRRMGGWSIGERMTADPVVAALDMAIEQRKPSDVVHRSDQGGRCTSIELGSRCKAMGVRPSMGNPRRRLRQRPWLKASSPVSNAN